ncbi:MAG: DUF262 domain-containing HNH endonuclease family protein [Proteobacteria bacterium]|nr:DUF262 domain-containing HNH endonuclease family protein [Pseudomonadota bacterium]
MAELHVSKKSVQQILDTNVQYIIPDYQRPYKWDKEKCEVLWDDISSFFEGNKDNKEEYYLGTLVLCKGKEAVKREVIDGQQRLTSFVLMLRAFYKKFEKAPPSKDIEGLKRQVEPCIWEVRAKSREADDKTKTRITSKVITVKDNRELHSILETGETGEGKSNYQENYKFFCKACDDYAQEKPTLWDDFCLFILERCILLPIECKDIDAALNIFYTLNDRGMPLADTDIFKAKIYEKRQGEEKKQEFIKAWKELEEIADKLKDFTDDRINIISLFRYYSHYIRGKEKNTQKEIGLRKFYSENNYQKLNEPNLMANLKALAEFWDDVLSDTPSDEYIETKGGQYLHCLWHYPNDYWRSVVSVFFLMNRDANDFSKKLTHFLSEATAFFYAKFITNPTVNAVKDDVYRKCKELCNQEEGNLKIKEYSVEEMKKQMKHHIPPKAERGLLLLHAYLHDRQEDYMRNKLEVEHIFPQKWQNTNYNGWSWNDAESFLQNIGNKVIIEKKVNIEAGNGYFGKKKEKYKKSKISEVKDLSLYGKDDWLKEDIEKREDEVIENLINFFNENKIFDSK